MEFVGFMKISSTFDWSELLILFAILRIIFSLYGLFCGWFVIPIFELIESLKWSSYILLILLIVFISAFIPFLHFRMLITLRMLWFHWLLRFLYEQEFRISLHFNGIHLFKLRILSVVIIRIRKLVNFLLVYLLLH